jgi:hypothetical protein
MYVCVYVHTHTCMCVCTYTHTHIHTQEWQPARHMGEAPGESPRKSQRTVSSRARAGYAPQNMATKLDIGDLEVCIYPFSKKKINKSPQHTSLTLAIWRYVHNKLKKEIKFFILFLTSAIWRYMSWSSGRLATKSKAHVFSSYVSFFFKQICGGKKQDQNDETPFQPALTVDQSFSNFVFTHFPPKKQQDQDDETRR